MKLSERIKQTQFSSAAQEALFNVMVTNTWISGKVAEAMAPYDITPSQYNVLRILRGSHPEKMACSDIGERLLDRTPDVTRLLNRLQRSGFIHRARASHDRRVVEVHITEKGLALLSAMQQDVEAVHKRIEQHLSEVDCQQLSVLLERMRSEPA